MVESNKVNMLKEFRTIKKCELIILTTFSFDPVFFDHMTLRDLRKGNPYAKIVVLTDSNHFDVERRTSLTGSAYRMITLPSIFHPKMFIFSGHDEKTSFIGSHNLTLPGFSQNLELTCKIKDQSITHQCLDSIISILSKFLAIEDPLITDIKKQIGGRSDLYASKHKDIRFIHNLKLSILDQAISFIKELSLEVKEVKIISPFHSQVSSLVKKMKRKIHPSVIYLCVQKNNHTLNPKQIENISYVSTLEVRTKKKRRIHSKIILFKGSKKEVALIGSPNFTGAAMNEMYQIGKGNFEAALLVEGGRISGLLSELDFSGISPEEIEESRIKESPTSSKGYPYSIVSANYDIFGSLQINFFSSSDLTETQINIQPISNKDTSFRYYVNIDLEKKQIVLQPEKKIRPGTMVWLSSDKGDRISNKACINVPESAQGFMTITEVKSIEKILKVLSGSKTLEDLIRLMLSMRASEDYSSDRELPQTVVQKEDHRSVSAYPSRMKTTVTGTDILEFLENLFRSHHSREYTTRSQRVFGSISHVDKKKIKDRVKKLPLKFAKYFEMKWLQVANDPSAYTLYILFSIKLFESVSRTFQLEELFELLLAKSMVRFEELYKSHGISEGDCSRLLSLLIFVQTQKGCHMKKEVVGQIADKSSLNPKDLLDFDFFGKMGLSVTTEEAYSKLAESIILSTLKKRTDFWKHFVPKSGMIKNLSKYYQTLIPEYKDITEDVFRDAITGNEWSIMALNEKGCYPLIGNDGLPEFAMKVAPGQILEKTFEILRPGFKIFDEQKNMFVYLKRLLLEEIERLLRFVSLEAWNRFVPGNLIKKMGKH